MTVLALVLDEFRWSRLPSAIVGYAGSLAGRLLTYRTSPHALLATPRTGDPA